MTNDNIQIDAWSRYREAKPERCNGSVLLVAQLRILAVFFIWAFFTAPEVGCAAENITTANEIKSSPKHAEALKYLGQHQYAEAEKAFKQVLSVTPPSDEKSVVDLLNYIGATLHAQKKEPEALLYFNKALTALPKNLSSGDIRKAKILSNLCLVYSAQGDMTKAMQCSEEAISIFHAQKASPADLGVLLNSHGLLKMKSGDYNRAADLFAESIELRERKVGKDSITLVSPLVNLSSAYVQEKKFTEAESTCRRAIIICQQQDGKGSEMLFPLLCNLGSIQIDQNKHNEAISTYKRAKEIAERYFGRNSEETLMTCFALSEFYEKDGQRKLAEEHLSRAVEISRLLYGAQHKKTIEATMALAQLFQMHGNTSEAERLRTLCRLSLGK